MANTVKLKRSAVQGKAPVVGDLALGELAINTYDGKLYTKKNDGSDSIVEIGAGGGSGAVDSVNGQTGTVSLDIDDLTDVDTSSVAPTDGQVLTWVNANSKWEPATPTPSSRTSVSVTQTGATQDSVYNLTLTGTGKAGLLLAIESNYPAWITVYTDTASRTADASRLSTADPDAGSGVLVEVSTTTANERVRATPGISYFNDEATPVDELYLKVVYNESTTQDLTITLDVLSLEA